MNKSKIVEFEAGKNLTAHDNSKLECSLSPNFKKYLIDRGETYCSQCGKLLKVRK